MHVYQCVSDCVTLVHHIGWGSIPGRYRLTHRPGGPGGEALDPLGPYGCALGRSRGFFSMVKSMVHHGQWWEKSWAVVGHHGQWWLIMDKNG